MSDYKTDNSWTQTQYGKTVDLYSKINYQVKNKPYLTQSAQELSGNAGEFEGSSISSDTGSDSIVQYSLII